MDVTTLKKEVTCSVCEQPYREPKQLPCLHIFCLECLNNIARTSARPGKIKCPLCQIEIVVPESGTMESLPSCSYPKNILDALAIKECSTSKVTCGNCEMKSEETSYCFHCAGFWCNVCLEAHNILRANRDHNILMLKDFQEKDVEVVLKRPAFCQKVGHEREALKFYYKMCAIPVCQNCVDVEHGKHDVEYLEVTATAVKNSMAAQLEASEKERQTFSNCLRELEAKSRGIKQHSHCVITQIQDLVKSLIHEIQQSEQELIMKVEEEAKIKQDRVTKNETIVRDHLKKVDDTMSQARHFIDFSTTADLVRAKASISELLQKHPAPELITSTQDKETFDFHIVFLKNKALCDSMQNSGIGILAKTDTKVNQCTVEDLKEASAGLETRFKLLTRNAKGKQSYSPGDHVVVELASIEDGTLAGETKIVNKNNGSYEVSCIPKREGKHEVTARVNGEDVSNLELLVMHVKNRSYKLVQTVSGRGTGAGESLLWGVAVNDKNEIIVSDKKNNRLQVFNEKGNFIKTVEHELLSCPSGICIGNAGRIYVAAMNKILLFNPNGNFIKEICYEENQDWGGMTSDKQGNIIVCCKGGVRILSPEVWYVRSIIVDAKRNQDCFGQVDYSNHR
ncbi:E3 ubiquitin-protein ligase TRIM71-like [Oculina patagonica]